MIAAEGYSGIIPLVIAASVLVDLVRSSRRLRASTKRVYVGAVQRFEAFAGGEHTLAKLDEFTEHLLAEVKPQTARKILAAVTYASRRRAERHQGEDFAEGFESPPPAPGKRREAPDLQESRAIVGVCKNDSTPRGLRDTAIVEIPLVATAARRSGLEALNRDSFDVSQRTLKLVRKGGWVQLCHLDAGTCETIAAWLAVRGGRAGDPMFVSLRRTTADDFQFGERLSGAAISDIVAERAKQAGIRRRLTTHHLRHGFFALGLMAGQKLERLAEAAGHRSPTDRAPRVSVIYRHDLLAREQPVGAAIRKLLEGKEEPNP